MNKWQATLYINFIDFEKSFDSIHRLKKIMEHLEKLWNTTKNHYTTILKQFYNEFNCTVLDGCKRLDWFEIKAGVKQGCNMSRFLFLVALDWLMRKTVEDGEKGIRA